MLIGQILNSNEPLVKFRAQGDEIEILEGDEQAIVAYLGIEETPGSYQRNKEEHLRHYAITLENTVALQEGRGLEILSDEFPNPSPAPTI